MKQARNRSVMISLIALLILLVLLFIDLITKAWAEATNVSQTFIPGFMNFRFVKNTGIAFSLFDDNRNAMIFITCLTVVMIVGIGVLFFTVFKKNVPAQIVLAIIEAGAIGNLVDRVCLSYVRDFADVSSIGFGVCNIADFYVTFGAVALVIIILFIGKDAVYPLKKSWREQKQQEEAGQKGNA